MGSLNSDEFADRVLSDIGELGAGQTATAEDVAEIKTRLPSFFSTLASDDVVLVADPEEIPEEWAASLARLFINENGSPWGVPWSKSVKDECEAVLRKQVSSRPTYETQAVDYF